MKTFCGILLIVLAAVVGFFGASLAPCGIHQAKWIFMAAVLFLAGDLVLIEGRNLDTKTKIIKFLAGLTIALAAVFVGCELIAIRSIAPPLKGVIMVMAAIVFFYGSGKTIIISIDDGNPF